MLKIHPLAACWCDEALRVWNRGLSAGNSRRQKRAGSQTVTTTACRVRAKTFYAALTLINLRRTLDATMTAGFDTFLFQ